MNERERTSAGLPVGDSVGPCAVRAPEHRERRGRGLHLRALEPARDTRALHGASHGTPEAEALWTYMAYGPFASMEKMQVWLEERAKSDDPLFLAVVDATSKEAIGMTSFMRIDTTHGSIELGNIWYVPTFQRGGANPEVVYLMLAEAFEELGFRRVEWKCDALNERSRRAALRLGFTFEGIFRKHYIIKGRNRDTAWFSMLDDEWPTAKAALEAYLTSRS